MKTREGGMPDAACMRCNTRLAVDFQKKGDWCKAHQRPESQCFICHPVLQTKSAALHLLRTESLASLSASESTINDLRDCLPCAPRQECPDAVDPVQLRVTCRFVGYMSV